jgi:hypothetical protein
MATYMISKVEGKYKSCQYSDERDDREGLRAEALTITGLLKPLGYAAGKFGRNHLKDFRRPLGVGESGC